LVADTDLVLTAPSRVARIFEPPLPLAGFELTMWWHPRTERDPARRWLREQILAAGHLDRREKSE
jgi:DNA-binding transcriptional LysR family regulator